VTAGTIPLGDAEVLRRPGNRTRTIRLLLAGSLAALGVLAFHFSRSPSLAPTPLLPAGSSGIIVLDVSGSVEGATLDRIYASMSELANSNDRFGMVIFASRAYEALPPNTPARELAPLARFFRPLSRSSLPKGFPSQNLPFTAHYPANPWQVGFDTGTEISKGLELAESIIAANPATRRSVWLISDLADDPQDLGTLTHVATDYTDDGITLNVIGLDPSSADVRIFQRFLGPSGTFIVPKRSAQVRLERTHGFPTALLVCAVLIGVLLAANELLSSPMRWGSAAPQSTGGGT
jgi:hypothetical protein